jgi:glycosyltransferase involved in cell wall biosynthesis
MKILHVIASLSSKYGGPTMACLDMAKAMANRGHDVKIYTTNIDGSGELDVPLDQPVWQDNVEISYFPIQSPRFFSSSFPLAIALKDIVPSCDIVHIHSLYLFHTAVTGFYCRYFGIPYVLCPHGALDPFMYKHHRLRKSIVEFLFDNHNLKNASAVHFTTTDEQQLAQPYILGANSFVVPLGFDIEDYKNLPPVGTFKSQYPNLEGKKIILFFGRLNFKKGIDILVKAFAQVAKVRQDVHLVLAGPDNENYGEQVKKWLEAEGVSHLATFTGMLKGVDKLAVLNDADLFILSSYSENFGISVVEAMICGLPVIISDQVNIWRDVEETKSGRVCPCDPDQFAAKILELLENPELCQQMGMNGKQLIKDRFHWSSVAKSLEHEYKLLIK